MTASGYLCVQLPNCITESILQNQPSLWSCPTDPLSIFHTVDRSLRCTVLCGTVSQCLSTPQTLYWLTRAAPKVRSKNVNAGKHVGEMLVFVFSLNTDFKGDRIIGDFRLNTRHSWVYLTSPGFHIPHVGCVVLQGDDLSKVHVLVEELRTKSD